MSFSGMICVRPTAIVCGGCGEVLVENRVRIASLTAYRDPDFTLVWLDDANGDPDVNHVCEPTNDAPYVITVINQADVDAMRTAMVGL